MENDQRQQLKQIIDVQISELSESIELLEKSTQPIPPSNAIGRLSRMEAINEKSIKEASLSQAKQRVNALKRTLGRLGDEDFGCCIRCEEAIPFARLEIIPESKVCMNCLKNT